jgi:hypothetical protein
VSGEQEPAVEATATHAGERASLGAVIAVVAVFALLFAVELFEAVSNLVALPTVYASLGIVEHVPWAILVAGIAVPVVLFASAVLLGSGRPLFSRAVMLLIALAASNALAITLTAVADRLFLAALAA